MWELIDWILFVVTMVPVSYYFVFSFASLFDSKPINKIGVSIKKLLFVSLPDLSSLETLKKSLDEQQARYDAVVILKEEATYGEDFSLEASSALAEHKIVQAHLVTKNKKTFGDLIKNALREVDNSIYKKGHYYLGYSSTLDDSGFIIELELLKECLVGANTMKDLRKNIYKSKNKIGYLDKSHIRINYCSSLGKLYAKDKIQQIMPAKRVLLLGVMLLAILAQIFFPMLAWKWWICLGFCTFFLCMTIPVHIIPKKKKTT